MSVTETTLTAPTFEQRTASNKQQMDAVFEHIQSSDKGAEAVDRMRARAQAAAKAKKVFKFTILIIVGLVLLVAAALGYYGYMTRVTGYLVDERQCKWMVGDTELTGSRLYSYPYQEYFGYRFINTKVIDEKTKIDIAGNPIQVVGLSGDDFWVVNVGMGERGKQVLKHADNYIFTMGKNVAVAKYKTFCK